MEKEIVVIETINETEIVTIEKDIEYITPVTQEKSVTPTTSEQLITPDTNYTGLSKVTVGAVTSSIDSNITQNNIKSGVTILGVTGNVEPDKPDQTKTVTPTTNNQTITPDTGYELASVTVNGVTSSIDENIQPENIKKDVSILGVTGTATTGGVDLNEYFNINPTTISTNYEWVNKNWNIKKVELNIPNTVKDLSSLCIYSTPTPKIVCENNVTNMYNMYANSRDKYIDVSGLNTSNVTNFGQMFSGCINVENLDLSNFNTSKCGTMNMMFNGCTNLKNVDLSSFNTANVTVAGSLFNGCNALEEIDLSNFNTQNIYNMSNMFQNCYALKKIDLSNFNCNSLQNVSYLCSGCTALNELKLPINYGTNAINMSNMLYNCQKLTTLPFDKNITIKAANMSAMLRQCYSLTSIDLSNFDMSSVGGNCNYLCHSCSKVEEIILPDSYTSTSLGSYLAYNCYSLKKLVIPGIKIICSNTLNNCYHFTGTTNATYNPTGARDGYIYVPDNLVDSYKTATGWVTYASQIKGLSELED